MPGSASVKQTPGVAVRALRGPQRGVRLHGFGTPTHEIHGFLKLPLYFHTPSGFDFVFLGSEHRRTCMQLRAIDCNSELRVPSAGIWLRSPRKWLRLGFVM